MTIDEAINFTDVANRVSSVRSKAAPSTILSRRSWWARQSDTSVQVTTSLRKAIIEDDLEAFVNIITLHDVLAEPIPLEDGVLDDIVANDRAEMLNEFIRRTGLGVNVEVNHSADESNHSDSTAYLGLSVHGKKRRDLVDQNDPNAQNGNSEGATIPLLWKAVKVKAHNIIDYLSGDRPLAAYKFYASSNKGKRAEKLCRTQSLADVLPSWLGWNINGLNESPLSAAILAKDLEVIEKLLVKSPLLLGGALHDRWVADVRILPPD
jgi:hypothetical protein